MHRFCCAILLVGCVNCVSAARLEQAQAAREAADAELETCRATSAESEERVRSLQASLNSMIELQASSVEKRQAFQSELEALRERNQLAERELETQRELMKKFTRLMDAGRLEVALIDGRLVLRLPSDVLFDSGSAKLSEQGRATLLEVGGVIAEIDRRFQVEGHTDNVPIKTGSRYRDNWELAAARSIAVVYVLIDAHVPPGRLSAASFADLRPAYGNDTAAGRARNRRIEIIVVPVLPPSVVEPASEKNGNVENPDA